MMGKAKYSTPCLSICPYTKILFYIMVGSTNALVVGEEKTTHGSRGS
jgi:hypothetical protein